MLTQQRFSSLTSPGQKRPWIDTLKQRARMAYQQANGGGLMVEMMESSFVMGWIQYNMK